jgi:solute carrier family 35, member C2
MSERRSSEDCAYSNMSDSEEHELGQMESDVEYDEETGLSTEERRKHLSQQRKRNQLDARISGVSGSTSMSKDEARQADKDVVRRVITNTILIGLWYFFSLSISIVSDMMDPIDCLTNSAYSTTNGCSHQNTSISTSLYSRHRYTCSYNSF